MGNFLKMIQMLRQHEEVVLYSSADPALPDEEKQIIGFLEEEYAREANDHPYDPPAFHEAAAFWAARTIYISAQLMLHRETRETELPLLLPGFEGTPDAAAVLSADLCLRFLPDMLFHLKIIDPEDGLIGLLEGILKQWHFSSVNYRLEDFAPDIDLIVSNNCIRVLYTNRIIENKRADLARHPLIADYVAGTIGIFEREFWKDLKIKE